MLSDTDQSKNSRTLKLLDNLNNDSDDDEFTQPRFETKL